MAMVPMAQVLACYEYVRKLKNVMFDYSKIVMGGNSRGGYSAFSIATRTDFATHIMIVSASPEADYSLAVEGTGAADMDNDVSIKFVPAHLFL